MKSAVIGIIIAGISMKVGKQLSQHDTPLYTGLKKHASTNPVQFHIPGHKKGAGMDLNLEHLLETMH